MIITPDDRARKRLSDPTRVGPEEPPPSYSPSDPSPFKTKPTNFLALSNERHTIQGEFVLDPSIRIPSSMLPPLGDDETEDDRKHLRLTSTNGSVHAEIWLLGSPCPPPKPRRTAVALTSDHGSIHAQLRALDGAAPFSLTARAAHGAVRLALPRSFQGLLSLSTRHGGIAVSDALVQNATQLSPRDATRRYFVGNFELLGEGAWEGDQVEIEAPHGSIRVRYVDDGAEALGGKGLLNRLFGRL